MFNNDDSATIFIPKEVSPVNSPAEAPQAATSPSTPTGPKRSRKGLVFGLIALVIVGVGATSAVLLSQRQQDIRSKASDGCGFGTHVYTKKGCVNNACADIGSATATGECYYSVIPFGGCGTIVFAEASSCYIDGNGQCQVGASSPTTTSCSGGGPGPGTQPTPPPDVTPPTTVCTPSNCDPTQSNICCPNGSCVKAWDGCGGGGGAPPPPPPQKKCGETCSVNTDCANAATPGVSVICRNGFCENADCPTGQTVFGANCACGSNSRLCGQTCGATVGLCAEGLCSYVAGPSCAVGAPTYCAGTLNGYQRLACVDRDQLNSYLSGPSGKTSAFSEAEIRASCSPVCPIGGTTGRKASCGGLCQVDSDCRAPSGGGTAACRGGVCENTACPVGKTLAGAACLCAGSAIETQQCGQPCGSFGLCAPGQGICRYINTGGNNCPWGWSQTYCVSTLNGFTTPQCAFGDTGGAYLVAPDGRASGITVTELRQSCQACGDGVVQPGEDCDDGAANGTSASVCDTACKATNCSLGTPPPTPSPTPVPVTGQCLLIKIFDENWQPLSLNELATFVAGRKVRFTVGGNTNSGSFDQARFTINGTLRPVVTGKRPDSEEFFDEFTIPTGITTFTVNAELHHSTLGWF